MYRLLPALRQSTRSLVSAPSISPLWQSVVPTWNFSLSSRNGWMPKHVPLRSLPSQFADVEYLLQQMPITKKDGTAGLLSTGRFGEAVLQSLKFHDVSRVEDPALVTALHRDYSFLASAYLLEPSHIGMALTKNYGEARDHLPETIAIPLDTLGRKLDGHPWLDYAHGYALNNWYLVDKEKGFDYRNIKLIRQFDGGVDEEGFVVIHISMVAKSHRQIAAHQAAILAASHGDDRGLASALNDHAAVLDDMFSVFGDMWKASSPKQYLGFRTFIMGITGNDSLFPNGVVYRGCAENPRHYRGETGAQDSIVPATDIILGMKYPTNNLTAYLYDLRAYRPKDHRTYLNWLREASSVFKLRENVLSHVHTCVALLRNLEVVRKIRTAHWTMTNQYIIRNTKHPKATGGTPITTWLPNQLSATLENMSEARDTVVRLSAGGQTLTPKDANSFREITTHLDDKIALLKKEVEALQAQFVEQEANEFSIRESTPK
eukprot:m.398332 g.398332  ORF g.398332 m.398332 type:complete len:489 (-) comp56428_c0_seq3:124-1590(-)